MLDTLIRFHLLPSWLIRLGIYWQLQHRLRAEHSAFLQTGGQSKAECIEQLQQSAIALSTQQANQQHYEVPTTFYQAILGPRLKYSCCYYPSDISLADAEAAMLALYCERAELADGQRILDLGCGWGSFSLYAAAKYPNSQITAVSNSATQKHYIDSICQQNGWHHVQVITADVNQLDKPFTFDRIVSIEMFEHIRNYADLFARLANWLTPSGKLFVHHFCHQYLVYPFNAADSWMARHFFRDGLMPSEDLLLFFTDHFQVANRWRVGGRHYSQTCYHWLTNLNQHRSEIIDIFSKAYDGDGYLRYRYWEIFIRACAQLFAFNGGNEWFVTHYLFNRRG